MISYLSALGCSIFLLLADQYTKYFISTNMELFDRREFINGFIDITYIHNTGGAWGIFSGLTWFLLSLTVIVMIICITLLFKVATKSRLLFWAISLVMAGGLGNMIDRIFRDGSVVDFLHFEFWPTFPVFNIADIGVVVGAGLLILYFVIDTVNEYKKTNAQKKEFANEED